MSTTILVVVVDTSWLLFRLKRALRAEFPDESLKGITFYALMRVLQLRWLRMPKPQVKVGGAPQLTALSRPRATSGRRPRGRPRRG